MESAFPGIEMCMKESRLFRDHAKLLFVLDLKLNSTN